MDPTLRWTLLFALVLTALMAGLIALQCDGRFFYFLDDAYIHLALAENLPVHYGLSGDAVAAASSSILYPWLLMPGRFIGGLEWTPLALNTLGLMGAGWMLARLGEKLPLWPAPFGPLSRAMALMALLLLGNVFTLTFSGLEHVLHLFCSLLILHGLMARAEGAAHDRWLYPALVLNPLLRYEGLALSLAVLAFLLWRGEWRRVVPAFTLILLLVGGFSLYLHHLGLAWLPSSVLVKDPALDTAGLLPRLRLLLDTLVEGLATDLRMQSLLGLLILLALCGAMAEKARRPVVAIILASGAAHLLLGRFGWSERYQAYIVMLTVLAILYAAHRFSMRRIMVLAPLLTLALLPQVAYNVAFTATIPRGAANVHAQQFQLHRFVNEFYRAPVFANDIGWLNYQSDFAVLDACGLGSEAVRRQRRRDWSAAVVRRMVAAADIHLAILYPDGCVPNIPPDWRPVARLGLTGPRYFTIRPEVVFYQTNGGDATDLMRQLAAFQATLPAAARLTMEP